MDRATVSPDAALPEQGIVGRNCPHLSDDSRAVARLVFVHRSDRLHPVEDSPISPGLVHGRVLAAIARGEALCPVARAVVEIPIEGFGQKKSLGCAEAHRMNIADEG